MEKHRLSIEQASEKGSALISKTAVVHDKALFEYSAVANAAKERFKFRDNSTTEPTLKLTVSDESFCKEPIVLTSSHNCPWMLPWTVQVGAKKWDSYSKEIPLKLLDIANPKGSYRQLLLDGKKYWSEDFGKDSEFWSAYNGPRLEADTIKEIFMSMHDYKSVGNQFEFGACQYYSSAAPSSIYYLELKSRKPRLISAITCTGNVSGLKLEGSGKQMVSVLESCESFARNYPWLTEWSSKPNCWCEVNMIKPYDSPFSVKGADDLPDY